MQWGKKPNALPAIHSRTIKLDVCSREPATSCNNLRGGSRRRFEGTMLRGRSIPVRRKLGRRFHGLGYTVKLRMFMKFAIGKAGMTQVFSCLAIASGAAPPLLLCSHQHLSCQRLDGFLRLCHCHQSAQSFNHCYCGSPLVQKCASPNTTMKAERAHFDLCAALNAPRPPRS